MEERNGQRIYRGLLNVTQFWCSIFNLINGVNLAICGAIGHDGRINYILIMCGVSLAVSHLFALVKSELREESTNGYSGLLFRIIMLVKVSGVSFVAFVMVGYYKPYYTPVDKFILVKVSIGYVWYVINTTVWIFTNGCCSVSSNNYTRKRGGDSSKVVEATTKNKTTLDEEEGIYENGDVVICSSI